MPNNTTITEVIKGAFNLIGRLGPGRSPGPSEKARALTVLNELVDSWSGERLMVPQIIPKTWALVNGQQEYEIGPGAADFDWPRPVRIQAANIIYCDLRTPLRLLNPQEWSSVDEWLINETGLTGILPRALWNDQDYPISNLTLWPIPATDNTTLELFVWEEMATYAAYTDIVNLPPAYERALRYNLAVAIAPEVGKGVPPNVAQIAAEAKATIARQNALIFNSYYKRDENEALVKAGIQAVATPTPGPPPSNGQGNTAT